MEIWKPECDFRIFATERYRWKGTEKFRKRIAREAKEAAAALAAAEAAKPVSETQSTPAVPAADMPPLLDLGVKANRDFEVNEFIKLYGSAADLTDEQDDEMRMETSQLKADVSTLTEGISKTILTRTSATVQCIVEWDEELLPDLHGSR